MQQPDGLSRNQRRLLGRIRNDYVARHQRRGDLTHEDCQRKIPWRDRDEDAAATQTEHVALARRSRHRLAFAEQLASLRGIVTAEIRGLADFRDRIIECLAAFAVQQRDETRRAPFYEIGRLLQRRRARLRWRSAPVLEAAACSHYRRIGLALGRVSD